MYAKLSPVLARVLSVNMNLLTYTKTTSLCFCLALASWHLFISHHSEQLCNCPIYICLFALQMKLIRQCVPVKACFAVKTKLSPSDIEVRFVQYNKKLCVQCQSSSVSDSSAIGLFGLVTADWTRNKENSKLN